MDVAAQTLDFLRQNDAEFGDQSTQPVVGGRTFLDKALPGAVYTEDVLLMLFLDWHKTHVRARDGFADGGSIRRIVLAALAAHPVGCDELGCNQTNGVSVLTK